MPGELKYSLYENKLNAGENKYLARTHVTGIYDFRMLVKRLASKGVYKDSEYEGFFRELISVSKEVMVEGNAIHIGKILKLTPVVKGSFSDITDGYTEGRNYIDINARVGKDFVNDVTNNMVIEKIKRPTVKAELKKTVNVKTKENELCKHFSNKIFGNFFFFYGFKFAGIELMNRRNAEQKASFRADDLNISDFTTSCLNFTFRYDLQMPEWLTDGLEIYVRFLYEEDNDDLADDIIGKDIGSEQIITKWKEL